MDLIWVALPQQPRRQKRDVRNREAKSGGLSSSTSVRWGKKKKKNFFFCQTPSGSAAKAIAGKNFWLTFRPFRNNNKFALLSFFFFYSPLLKSEQLTFTELK